MGATDGGGEGAPVATAPRFRVYLHMLDFLLMQRHAEARLPRTRERSCLELDTGQAAAARSVIRRRCPSGACSAEILHGFKFSSF